MSQELIMKDPDSLLRLTLMKGEARVLMARTTRMTQEAAQIHQASDTCIASMGRLLPACAMLGGLIKEQEGRLTVTVAGDGAGGRLTCGAQNGQLKIAVDHPQAELPKREDGKWDVAGFVGREGSLMVVKDFKKGEPYTSISRLVSGELGEDFAAYCTYSEQVPSIVSLGCLNEAGTVLSSGGILVQAMPGCQESTIRALEMMIPFFANISRESYDRSLRQLAETWFSDFSPEFLGEEELRLRCDCSREKMRAALVALGENELSDIVEKDEPVTITCHFCRAERSFSPEEVASILHKEEPHDAD